MFGSWTPKQIPALEYLEYLCLGMLHETCIIIVRQQAACQQSGSGKEIKSELELPLIVNELKKEVQRINCRLIFGCNIY